MKEQKETINQLKGQKDSSLIVAAGGYEDRVNFRMMSGSCWFVRPIYEPFFFNSPILIPVIDINNYYQ